MELQSFDGEEVGEQDDVGLVVIADRSATQDEFFSCPRWAEASHGREAPMVGCRPLGDGCL